MFKDNCECVQKSFKERKLSVISFLDEKECDVAARCTNYRAAYEFFGTIIIQKLNKNPDLLNLKNAFEHLNY